MSKIIAAASSPMPVNAKILNLIIRHGVFTERYKTSLVQKIVGMFNRDITPDIERRLLKYLNKDTITAGMVKKLSEGLKDLKDAYSVMHDNLRGELTAFAQTDAKWFTGILKDVVPVDIGIGSVSPAVLKALVSQTYVEGGLVKDWFASLVVSTRTAVIRRVNIGMVEGQGIADIVRGVIGTKSLHFTDGILNSPRHEIERVVRTSISSIGGNIDKELYKANSDVIKSEQWSATLDTGTCIECGDLDGQVFDIGKSPSRPRHWNCRCRVLPVLKSWKELGINLQEAPVSTRASMDGQVPESMTWWDWVKAQDKDTQNEILGVKRAGILRGGKIPEGDFVSGKGRPLALGQLEKLENKLSKAG